MLIQSPEMFRLLDELAVHYRNHVCNQYIKPEFRILNVEREDWNLIENLTERTEAYRQQGFHLDEIYKHLAALARFIDAARSQLVPQIVPIIKNSGRKRSESDQLLAKMAAENLAGNVGVLAKLVYSAFLLACKEDEAANKGGRPLFRTLAECKILLALGQ